MPTLNGILEPEGALVAVEIGLSRPEVQRLRNAARPIPAPVSLKALLDTGAECSCLDPAALRTLVLPLTSIGWANISAVGGLAVTPGYDASLTIVHSSGDSRLDLVIGALSLVDVALASLGYEVLIGRDILGRCRFVYDGPGGRFRLRY